MMALDVACKFVSESDDSKTGTIVLTIDGVPRNEALVNAVITALRASVPNIIAAALGGDVVARRPLGEPTQ